MTQRTCSFFVVVGKFNYDRKKKDTVNCLAGARSLLRPEKKKIQSSVWWVHNHNYDRKIKRYSVCLAGCAVVSVFGSGGKLAVFLLWRESFITTGKKKVQSSVWWVVLLCQFLVLADNRQFFCCGGKVLLRPE